MANLKFLVDSGSVVSILPSRLFRPSSSKGNLILFAANSTKIPTFGTKNLDLELNLRRKLSWPFIIADTETAILGADFLKYYGLLIDLKNAQLIDTTTELSSKGKVQKASIYGISTINSDSPVSNLLKEFIEITKPKFRPSNQQTEFAHHIITNGPPVTERCRKLAGVKATATEAEIRNLLENNIIRPSSSSWSSPIHVVQKKDGSWRLCGDYRRLNSITVPDRYPPPLIQHLFPRVHNKSVFSIKCL